MSPSTDDVRVGEPGAALAGMTGFARCVASVNGADLAWEIKSVNGKGLDLRLRTPPGFDAEDAAFRRRIAAAVTRGSIQATLTLHRAPAPPRVRIDHALLANLVAALGEAVPPGAAVGPATLDGLMTIRGVVEINEGGEGISDQLVLAGAAHDLLDTALADLGVARRQEGAALGGLLGEHLDRIVAHTEAAERAPGRTAAAVRQRMMRSLRELFDTIPALDPNRLHQEAILMAMRADVREELDRLRLHGANARDLMAGGGAVGRRLDFLAQELAREANTLCAKSNDAALTAIGLELRNQIEQFREQVQNLE